MIYNVTYITISSLVCHEYFTVRDSPSPWKGPWSLLSLILTFNNSSSGHRNCNCTFSGVGRERRNWLFPSLIHQFTWFCYKGIRLPLQARTAGRIVATQGWWMRLLPLVPHILFHLEGKHFLYVPIHIRFKDFSSVALQSNLEALVSRIREATLLHPHLTRLQIGGRKYLLLLLLSYCWIQLLAGEEGSHK